MYENWRGALLGRCVNGGVHNKGERSEKEELELKCCNNYISILSQFLTVVLRSTNELYNYVTH